MRGMALPLLMAAAMTAAAEQKAFEVASIRPSAQGDREGMTVEPGHVTMRNMRLTACLRWAFDVQDYQVSAPGWAGETRFDIVAKAGGDAPEAELRSMMQNLLTDRFKLVFHRETRELPALILTVGKNGHKLTANPVEGKPSFKTGKMNLTGDGATLSQMTTFLSRELRQPVIDQTGLTGRFNYFLDINAYVNQEMLNAAGPGGGPPHEASAIVAQAMQSQLGLKVESKKAAVEMLIVDHLEKTPTEN